MKFACGLIILFLSCFIKLSIQFSSGAPISACPTLLPNHRGIEPQTTTPPYTLTTTELPNGNINVKIQALDDKTFNGFLMQGRGADSNIPVGSFNVPSGVGNYQTMTCVTDADSATHTTATSKTEINILWIPPIGFTGRVYFIATLVHDMSTFWGDVRSATIDITENSDEIYKNCDGPGNCYGSPTGCTKSRDCDAVAVVHMNNSVFQFELKTGPSTDTFKPKYIGFGISNGQSMASISVIECEVGLDGAVSAYTSYTEVTSTGRGSPRTGVPQNIIRLIESSYQNEVIHCLIERDTVTTVNSREYNLLTGEFYVHIVAGSTLLENEVGFHDLALKTTDEQDLIYYIERSTDPIYDNCVGNAVCFGAPLECVKRRNCEAIAVVHFTDDKFQFELKTMLISTTQPPAYIAFGISDEPSMADISVVECTIEQSEIYGYISQTEITETSRNSPRTDISQNIVRLIESTHLDGVIHCLIERDTVSTIRNQTYDLLNEQYYIHLVVGAGLRENSVGLHNLNRATSTEKISLFTAPIDAGSIYEGCGVTKGCFGHPRDCVDSFDCLAITAIHFIDDGFQFEMLADNRNTPRYVAFGLSESTGMGHASVIECVVEDGSIRLYSSFTESSPYSAPRTDVPQDIVQLVQGTFIDGQIHCIVKRDLISEVRGQTFDLMNDEYFLLISSGTLLRADSVDTHDRGRLISGLRQSLRDLTFASASTASIKVHGIFMIVAWIGTSTIGIVLARYFKKTWVGNQMCGKVQWFAWHRICMISTGLLTFTAFIVIFVEIDGWSAEDNPHAILGTIVTGICLLQILGGMFRPPPDAKHRMYFNWGHMLFGSSGQILAIITIFFSVTLTKAELSDEFYWVTGAFCIFYIIIYILFQIMQLMGNKQKHSLDGEAPYAFLRKMMLGFFIIVTVLFVVALSVIIGLAPL